MWQVEIIFSEAKQKVNEVRKSGRDTGWRIEMFFAEFSNFFTRQLVEVCELLPDK